ncbi:Uncharacterised protein [Mycobacterium tuberculosis]|uniref:Uncharacterized protein n=1 Tax=Mycobacterium tuberculosis TaxID=1773 RepID=A0A0U0TF68_MYCTX|nr:Uncharacterised protein [Mycobacterium tuberculosis]
MAPRQRRAGRCRQSGGATIRRGATTGSPSARARADRRVRRSARRRTGPATCAARPTANPELVGRMAVWVVRSGRARHAPRSCSPARCGTCGPSSPETPPRSPAPAACSCRTCGTTGRARQIAGAAAPRSGHRRTARPHATCRQRRWRAPSRRRRDSTRGSDGPHRRHP